MTALWIILGIIAAIIILLVILLHFSVKAYIEADKQHVHLNVKYLGFSIYKMNIPENDKEQSGKDRSSEKDEAVDNEEETPVIELSEIPEADSTEQTDQKTKEDEKPANNSEPEEKSEEEDPEDKDKEKSENKVSLLDQYNEYKKYIPAGKRAFRKLLKLIRFCHLKFSLTIGNDDPYKAGLNFGRINAVVYNLLALFCCIFSVKIDSTDIKCDFENKTTDFYFSTAIYVRPSAVVALAAYIGIYFLKIRKSMKKLNKMAKETTNNE